MSMNRGSCSFHIKKENMKQGRKPKPSALKELEGNPGKRPINKAEPKPKTGMPSCPRHLNTQARKEWHRMAPQLQKLGLLTQIDRAALAGYCQCYGRWVEAEKKLKELAGISVDKVPYLYKTSNGNLIISPLLIVANKSLEQMHKFLVEFGLTPAARSRIAISGGESDDPLDKLLNTRKN